MPELPEVETIIRGLRKRIIKKKIIEARVFLPKIIRNNASDFIAKVSGAAIKKIWRRGKMIIIDLAQGKSILIHLKMSGQLVFSSAESPVTKHTHLIFKLSDGNQLRYLDMRQFGYFHLVDASMAQELTPTGADPLKISWHEFEKKLKTQSKKARMRIKPFLLNQAFIAGIGNIYADEILHRAGIHPLRRVHAINEAQLSKLYQAMQEILNQAIKLRGSSTSDYVDSMGRKGNYQEYHRVYQREGERCFVCQKKIARIKINGRSSYFCPKCQK